MHVFRQKFFKHKSTNYLFSNAICIHSYKKLHLQVRKDERLPPPFQMNIELETKRLFIRPIHPKDASFLFELMHTEGWLKNIGDRNLHTMHETERYIQQINEKTFFNYYVLLSKESQKSIGILSFIHRPSLELPDLGFALLPEYHKQGLAYEASSQFLTKIKEQKNTESICAITLETNVDSISLLKKLGFKWTSEMLDDDKKLHYFIFNFK